MNVNIRQENQGDFHAVFEVNTLAFGQEDEAMLVEQLRHSEAFIPELSLVAIFEGKVIGHILFSKIKIIRENQEETASLALAPMSVSPGFQQKGIGGQMIQHGIDKAKALHYKSVIVLGHEDYYPRFGFEPAEKWGIQSPYDVPSNVFMAIELVVDGLKNVSGLVQYPKEFDLV